MPCVRFLALALLVIGLGARPVTAAPPPEPVVAVLGGAVDGGRLEAMARGARAAASRVEGARVEVFDDGGTPAGLSAALRRLKRTRPVGVVAAPAGDLADAYWKAARGLRRTPVFVLAGVGPDLTRNRDSVWHLGPSAATEAVQAADALLAPLAARRVAVVHEDTPHGRALATSFARNLSRFITLAGIDVWDTDAGAAEAGGLVALEVDWIYAAVTGRYAVSFAKALEAVGKPHRCLFADGNRGESILGHAPTALEGSLFLDGPDPELEGRLGEEAVEALERADAPVDALALRAFEATRRLLNAVETAGGTKFSKVRAALEASQDETGVFGALTTERHRGIRFFPFTYWVVRKGRAEIWADGLLPTPGCGPPLGFGRPPPSEINEQKGRVGYLTYGAGDTRTIEQDLFEIGLSTNGKDPELDRLVRDEILGRAIRIAHQLFRREPDGTPIPGWSWGMTFATEKPSADLPRSRVWLGIVAGDHPAAGGQVIGSGRVAIYSTFLKRTMYVQHKLDPPLSPADRILLDGTYRWGEDHTLNFRSNKIRCLIDGFSSAVGLTLSHEFGPLCGCGHDTEHPTSIMNVVAGAGASWEKAVWIPSHQRSVTTTLGVEGL